jgi:hypothetical protein
MVNLQGEAADRFDVVVELLELFDGLDVVDVIDLAQYVLTGDDDPGAQRAWDDATAVERATANGLTLDEALNRFGFDRSELEAELAAEREAAKAKHPAFRQPSVAHDVWAVDYYSREMDYSKLAEGHNVEQDVDDEPEAVYIRVGDYWANDLLSFDFAHSYHILETADDEYLRLADADVEALGEFRPVA